MRQTSSGRCTGSSMPSTGSSKTEPSASVRSQVTACYFRPGRRQRTARPTPSVPLFGIGPRHGCTGSNSFRNHGRVYLHLAGPGSDFRGTPPGMVHARPCLHSPILQNPHWCGSIGGRPPAPFKTMSWLKVALAPCHLRRCRSLLAHIGMTSVILMRSQGFL